MELLSVLTLWRCPALWYRNRIIYVVFFYIDFQSNVLIIVAVEKQIIITYSESALLDFGIQNEMPMRHIVICVLPDITIFCHIIS
jgi:hypothetical protein